MDYRPPQSGYARPVVATRAPVAPPAFHYRYAPARNAYGPAPRPENVHRVATHGPAPATIAGGAPNAPHVPMPPGAPQRPGIAAMQGSAQPMMQPHGNGIPRPPQQAQFGGDPRFAHGDPSAHGRPVANEPHAPPHAMQPGRPPPQAQGLMQPQPHAGNAPHVPTQAQAPHVECGAPNAPMPMQPAIAQHTPPPQHRPEPVHQARIEQPRAPMPAPQPRHEMPQPRPQQEARGRSSAPSRRVSRCIRKCVRRHRRCRIRNNASRRRLSSRSTAAATSIIAVERRRNRR
ncbi:Peptidase C14, caspase catalytic subunit p20 precursor [Candidatus Paraburkholderia schumanniana]|nr:Peptidase C14, caspase catalytic subunit p20 precursor [Candidatus Paraburkholderia schumannianae]